MYMIACKMEAELKGSIGQHEISVKLSLVGL